MNKVDAQKFELVVERLAPGGRVLCVWSLEGGVSAQTVALAFEQPDGVPERAVVRLHGEADRAGNPDIAADEFRLLEIVQEVGIPVPSPLFLDRTCEVFDMPYLVVAFVDGATDFNPVDITLNVNRIAEQLAAIHRVDWSTFDLAFLPAQEESVANLLRGRPDRLDEALSEGRIRAALEAAWPPESRNPRGLLHGDYWPGNLLWNAGEISAVIDWEDAATGDPLADLGNCRLEILWSFGRDAMTAFTERYQSLMPTLDYANLPYWDLYAALHPAGKLSGWGLDAEDESRMIALHREFVDLALAERGREL